MEPSHDEGEGEDEVHFRENDPQQVETTPPTPITSNDMDVIIKGWEIKFEHILRCLSDVQLASDKANSDMFGISREGRAHADEQERRLEAMHMGLTEFLKKCDPAHLITSRHLDAPTASMPYTLSTPTGIPSRLRPDFEFQPSPVGQDEPTEPTRSTNSHTRDHDDIRNTCTRDHDDVRDTRTRDHDDIRDTRTRDHDDIRDTRAPEITTTSGTRAPENTTTLGTRAPETFTTIEIGAGTTDSTNDLHMKTIGEIAATCSEIHTIVE